MLVVCLLPGCRLSCTLFPHVTAASRYTPHNTCGGSVGYNRTITAFVGGVRRGCITRVPVPRRPLPRAARVDSDSMSSSWHVPEMRGATARRTCAGMGPYTLRKLAVGNVCRNMALHVPASVGVCCRAMAPVYISALAMCAPPQRPGCVAKECADACRQYKGRETHQQHKRTN